MDLSIIIVSWNVKEKLRENLKAIYGSQNEINNNQPHPDRSHPLLVSPSSRGRKNEERGELEMEVFVVDNDSADDSAEMVRNEFPQVQLIVNNENLGFAKANNQGIKVARGRYILLLNPDMKVFPDTLTDMTGWMDDNQQASVAGCHLIAETGETVKHVRRFPAISDQLAIVLKLPHIFPTILNKYLRNDFNYAKAGKVESVRGGFFMIRREAVFRPTSPQPSPSKGEGVINNGNKEFFTLPLLDERYFIWFEEVDYCRQIKELGGEVWYTPTVKCIDYVGQSFKQVKRGTTQNYFRESMLKYFKKWHPGWQYWILKSAWPIGLFIAWITEKLNLKGKAKT